MDTRKARPAAAEIAPTGRGVDFLGGNIGAEANSPKAQKQAYALVTAAAVRRCALVAYHTATTRQQQMDALLTLSAARAILQKLEPLFDA